MLCVDFCSVSVWLWVRVRNGVCPIIRRPFVCLVLSLRRFLSQCHCSHIWICLDRLGVMKSFLPLYPREGFTPDTTFNTFNFGKRSESMHSEAQPNFLLTYYDEFINALNTYHFFTCHALDNAYITLVMTFLLSPRAVCIGWFNYYYTVS